MKQLLLSIASMVIAFAGFSQSDVTLCHTPAIDKFALFASNRN